MTTPYTVSLPTSPEVRERLFAAGWTFEDTWPSPCWRKPNGAIVTLRLNGTWVAQGSPADIVEFAAILGIYQSPPGMVLVPLELAAEYRQVWFDMDQRRVRDRREELERKLALLFKDAPTQSPQQGVPSPLEAEASKSGFMLNQGGANLWRNPARDASPSAHPSVPAPTGALLKGDGER